MPIVEFFTSDPGLDRLASNTKVNIIEELAIALRLTAGRGSVHVFGAVLNDRGAPNVPVRLSGPEDIKSLYGGFKSWLGDAVDFGAQATYNDRGKLSGYLGNLAAQMEGLDAPLIVLSIPDMAIKDDIFGSGTDDDLLVSFERTGVGAGDYGTYSLPAGFRIAASGATPYMLATLEPVTWEGSDVTDKSVRVRQVSDTSIAPVALNTVNVLVDTPLDDTVAVSTAAVTVPTQVTAAEIITRYTKAFDEATTYAVGQIAELCVCDRTEALVVDALFAHAESASAEGYFRLAVGSPPQGTSATNAQGSGTDGVGRTTLKRTYGAYLHQGWTRQFPDDSANLNAETGYQHDIPSAMAFAFNCALFKPEENPANFTPNLTSYKITGVEALSPKPDRKAHEDAGIIQPVLEFTNPGSGNASLQPTFHGAPLASASIKFYTRRFAFYLYRNLLAISLPYHKALASPSNQQALLDAIDEHLEELLENERIGGFKPTTGKWDPTRYHFTVNVAVLEVGNMDALTLRVVYGNDVDVTNQAAA